MNLPLGARTALSASFTLDRAPRRGARRDVARSGSGLWIAIGMVLFALFSSQPLAGEAPSAKLEISGYGIFGNRELKNMLRLLEDKEKKRHFYDANFIEDAALILISRVHRDGFLKPEVTIRLTLDTGEVETHRWAQLKEEPLPRTLQARKVHFIIKEGVLYHYKGIEFRGLQSMPEKEARDFFVERGNLIPFKRHKVYTPGKLERGLSSLVEILQRRGYESAKATALHLEQNDRTGDVTMTIEVNEGKKSIVRSVRSEVLFADTNQPPEQITVHPGEPFSKLWLQDLIQQLRTTNYHRGYPDTTAEVSTLRRETEADSIQVDLLATVKTGPRISLGEVRFAGQKKTKESLLRRRVRLDEGGLLDRVKVEQGRYRLARLGVFDSVELNYEPVDAQTRNVIYGVKEGKRIDVSFLFGYGSYELLRAGFEVEQYNVFGRAHHARLRAVQSFKSSSAEYVYTMPEFVGEDLDVFLNASGLRRQEISFLREEFGGGAGVRKYFAPIASDLSLRYNYQVLNASEAEIDAQEGLASAEVGALITELRHDRRDNPLYPRKGYKVFGTLELATEYLAGDVNYQRLELAGSYHHPLDEGRWLHFGLSHGAAFTVAGSAVDLPFNRRFFPGGDSSIRGFQQGEAAPRNERGKIIGAETYLGANFEFEQALTPAWSFVTFFDAVGFARRVEDYPFNEGLFSVGGGLRWKTLIGPVRLEYGYNLNPREKDPMGTVHFSIGFPF
jgi:outer membrane protein insertion porin family